MPRRRVVTNREMLPDPVQRGDRSLCVVQHGKKSVVTKLCCVRLKSSVEANDR
jgi:hypothetical protein